MDHVIFPKVPMLAQNFCAGEWSTGGGERREILSPLNGQVIGHYHESNPSDILHGVEQAERAFQGWRQTPLKDRCQIMFRLRDILLRDRDKMIATISLENGKTQSEALGSFMKGIEVLEYALSLQNIDDLARLQVSRGVYCEYRREPLGVVAGITPFNFPAMVPMWTIPIALTLGNCYLWKPSEKTPLTAKFIAQAAVEAGLPAGVFSIIQGGRETVEAIIDHPLVAAIAFVGSSRVAKAVYQRGTNLGKRVLALGGAKNHILLLPDADGILAGIGIADSFTGCAGQRCMAASVLLAVGNCAPIIEKIKERAAAMVLGESMGAIISSEQRDFLNAAIARAEAAGAKILLDGRRPQAPQGMQGGYWLAPTILDHVPAAGEAAQVELFGPILSIIRCQTISQAIAIENSSAYGNAAAVFTSNGALADKVVAALQAGMVGINIGVPVPREPFSFGGINASKFGHGDITGGASLDFWSNLKKVTTKWEQQKDHNWMS